MLLLLYCIWDKSRIDMFKELKLYSICSTYSVAYINAGIILALSHLRKIKSKHRNVDFDGHSKYDRVATKTIVNLVICLLIVAY